MSCLLHRAEFLGDIKCPSCKVWLEGDEDRLYPFAPEQVECAECGHKFIVITRKTTTYEVIVK